MTLSWRWLSSTVVVGVIGFRIAVAGAAEVWVEPAEHSPAFPGAKLTIVSPASGETVPGPEVQLRLAISGYPLGQQTATPRRSQIANSDAGQHIHVILDNEPYQALYTVADPISLGALEPGAHTVRTFFSRSYHESVKDAQAYAEVTFYVGERAPVLHDLTGPTLTYSRPKGTYPVDASDPLLLDFYLQRVTLRPDGYRVRVIINGEAVYTATAWQPFWIRGLGVGVHQVRLQLVDAAGQVVPGAYNDTTRQIEITAREHE